MGPEGERTELIHGGEAAVVQVPPLAPETAPADAPGADVPEGDSDPGMPHVFISYRRADTGAQAFLLHDRLKRRFGDKNVFLDIDALKPGMDWREVIHARANACGVLIVLIGLNWLSLMKESSQRSLVEPVDDVARQELEIALRSESNVDVLPVLVDGATMPAAHELPTTLQRLTDRQAERLELVTYDRDVERLADRLITLSSEPRQVLVASEDGAGRPFSAAGGATFVERLGELITGNGHVVLVLGSGVNRGINALPDSERLTTELAERFKYHVDEHVHLSEVAQYVDVTWGRPDLHTLLLEKLAGASEPGAVHRFAADLQKKLESAGLPRRPFLVLTANFDTALERAFQDAGEPFHMAIYMAGTGRFMHIKPDGTRQEILQPNNYYEFPIQEDLRLSSTLIVKLHGAVRQRELGYNDPKNYVITEDNYIDYLSGSAVEQIVPVQILEKLKVSHCVFLGYDVADWSLRVLLKRVWGVSIPAKSWAVQPDADDFDEAVWKAAGVDLIKVPLDDFAADLEGCLRASR